MEAHQIIREWFNSQQDYPQGLALAKAHGVGGVQLRLLEAGANNFTQGKLRAALQGILDTLSSQANAPATVAQPAAQHEVATTAPDPPELLQLRARRTATFKQAQHHHGLLRTTPEGPERFEHAKQIKVLFRENQELWDAEKYYKQFGFLPQPTVATIDPSRPLDVLKRRNTVRTYITGYNKGKRGTPEKLAAWTAELAELDRILVHG